MPAPTSRPVLPCVMSVFEGNRGAEYSTWAFITTSPPQCPNLVTAQASTVRVYSLDEESGKLCEVFEFSNLAGNVCYLESLPGADVAENGDSNSSKRQPDSLLLGFCGHPRLTIVSIARQTQSSPAPAVLSATSLVDLTQALIDSSYGSVTPLEHDMVATAVTQKNSDSATVGIILGGGVAIVCLELHRLKKQHGGWMASEPFLLPLTSLQASIKRSQSAKSQSGVGGGGGAVAISSGVAANVAMATGFGDVLSTTFLPGYNEPTIVFLHSNPTSHGRVWSGRLGRPHWQPGTPHGMLLTAVSVTVAHRRSAVLWSLEVPADALSVHRVGRNGCLVICANSVLLITNAGRIEGFLAMNGYVRSTCPTKLLDKVQPNPKPFPKLAIQLDGAAVAFCSDQAVFVSLRGGGLYLLQLVNSVSGDYPNGGKESGTERMSMLPLGRAFGGCGNIESLIAWPMAKASNALYDKFSSGPKEEDKQDAASSFSMGLLFAGSRLGNSYFAGYALENMTVPLFGNYAPEKKIKRLDSGDVVGDDEQAHEIDRLEGIPSIVLPEDDEILRLEEEALYAPTSSVSSQDGSKKLPDIVPPSDEESDGQGQKEGSTKTTTISTGNKRKLAPISRFSVLHALTALDTLTGLGPVGPSCEGPIMPPNLQEDDNVLVKPGADAVPGAPAFIVPCGYGSSGGVGIMTVPGRDERSILAEVDCLGVESIFSLRSLGLVLLGNSGGGIRVMRLQTSAPQAVKSDEDADDAVNLIELDVSESAESTSSDSPSMQQLFKRATVLSCAEFADGNFSVVLSYSIGEGDSTKICYCIAVLKTASDLVELVETFILPSQERKGDLLSVTPVIGSADKSLALMFACTWSAGLASLVTFDSDGILDVFDFAGADADAQMEDIDTNGNSTSAYYDDRRIVAIDLFRAPANFFRSSDIISAEVGDAKDSNEGNTVEYNALAEDNDLYNLSAETSATDSASGGVTLKGTAEVSDEQWGDEILFVGLCRQTGEVEVFSIADLSPQKDATPIWSAKGCSYGVTSLVNGVLPDSRSPKQHEVCVREMRFFCCGPTGDGEVSTAPGFSRPLCLALETTSGDLLLYAAEARSSFNSDLQFSRVPLKTVSRESQEQAKFQAKLRRKGITNQNGSPGDSLFQHNRLHRFHALSAQDGLFAAVTRPIWLVAERGRPMPIVHRCRHASPSAGSTLPVSGFCSDLDGVGAYLTVHARVGRHGSQRLTLYKDITAAFKSEGLLPGGGLCFEKVALGVTVRHIQFIDDVSISARGRCLYAMLVSRETEIDMSHLNDDGMSQAERELQEQEKEAAKIKRQVEADLGGFDVNLEYVEEIERENCFQIDKELGGAPPIPQHTYALWIVDAAKNWSVVDSHELGEFDHGMTMKVMSLTEFKEDPGSANTTEIEEEDLENKLFITVGVGIVEKDGEDVSSKGRVLLFELKAQDTPTSQGVELSLACEKDMFHGPVTSLTCLSSDGKNRLIIGAGSDINVEQWVNGGLLQVGFYRATMQVLDIHHFKNFLLLSDAYDSIYFLIWRESDKSLTLLSKDYDPLVVYAAGTMSRGGNLTFICHDDRQNLQFFQYAPGEAAARGGNKLVCRADYHLGAQTSAFRNHACRSSLWVDSASPSSTLTALKQQDTFFGRSDDDQRLGVHFGTSDGGFGAIVPLSEPVYWRLAALQSVMGNALESDCALSQRSWRLYRRSYRRGGCRSATRKKGVVDFDIIVRYADLPLCDQEDLASSIGTTVSLILDNILELNCAKSVL